MTRKQFRLAFIGAALAVGGAAFGLILFAFRGNLELFKSPSEIAQQNIAPGSRIKIGGLVVEGSTNQTADRLTFAVTDRAHNVSVVCAGECLAEKPDLFREGQGVVAEGVLDASHTLQADKLLAKHDERYMPREVVEALKKQGRWQEGQSNP